MATANGCLGRGLAVTVGRRASTPAQGLRACRGKGGGEHLQRDVCVPRTWTPCSLPHRRVKRSLNLPLLHPQILSKTPNLGYYIRTLMEGEFPGAGQPPLPRIQAGLDVLQQDRTGGSRLEFPQGHGCHECGVKNGQTSQGTPGDPSPFLPVSSAEHQGLDLFCVTVLPWVCLPLSLSHNLCPPLSTLPPTLNSP
jgi:hypothetical protein